MGSKQNKTTYIGAVCNNYGVLATLASSFFALIILYICTHYDIFLAIEALKSADIVYLIFVAIFGVVGGVTLTAMIINSFRRKVYITDSLTLMAMVTCALGVGLYFLDNSLHQPKIPIYVLVMAGIAVLCAVLMIIHSLRFDKTAVIYRSNKGMKPDATFISYYKETNKRASLIILGILGIITTIGLYLFDKECGITSLIDTTQKIIFVGAIIGGIVLFYLLGLILRVVNKKVNVIDCLTFMALTGSFIGIILFGIKFMDGYKEGPILYVLIGSAGLFIISILATILLLKTTYITKIEEMSIATAQVAEVSTEEAKAEEVAEVDEALEEEPEKEIAAKEDLEEVAEVDGDELEEPPQSEEQKVLSEEVNNDDDIVMAIGIDDTEDDEELDMSLLQQLIDVQKEQTKMLAERFEEQSKINANINARLDSMDKNIKYIADVLGGLSADTLPNAQSIQVSLDDTQEPIANIEPAEEENNYFDEMASSEEEIEAAPEEDIQLEEAPEEGNWVDSANDLARIKPKMSFDMRLRVADDDIKKFYSDIKNALLSYGVHDRISRHRENFNHGRINIARMVINGKTLKVYLAVDPETIDKRYFHQTDVGHRKGLIDLPTMINVRSKVSARKVIELIDLIMESLVISKKKYKPVDWAATLTLDGYTSVQAKGFDYLVKKSVKLSDVVAYPDTFAQQLVDAVEDETYQERFIKTELSIDDIVANFNDGDVVDVAAVREKGLGAKNTNYLSIKESDSLDKKFKVYANEFTPNAIKMICLTGGETYIVVQPEATVEEV